MAKKRYEIKYYSSIKEEDIQWLWYPYIPLGKITLFQGDPGDGKSMFLMYSISCFTTGKQLPDGTTPKERITVLYQCNEDGNADPIKPRLLSFGADCEKVAFSPEEETPLNIEDIRIEEAIKDTGTKLIVFDPIQAYLPEDCDMLNAVKMRSVLKRLSHLAEHYKCAIVLVSHMTKSGKKKNLYRSLGSIDIAASARSMLMIQRDSDNPELRYIFPVKSNLAAEGNAVRFILNKDIGFHILGTCEWPKKEDSQKEISCKKTDKAEKLIRIFLSDNMMPSKVVLDQLKKAGISERTARGVTKNIGVKAIRKGNAWYWSLS